jgi:hypothetical protein
LRFDHINAESKVIPIGGVESEINGHINREVKIMAEDQALDIAKLFLIPSGLFLTALGSARTEPLKFAVSILGLVVTGFWIFSL